MSVTISVSGLVWSCWWCRY